MHAMKFDPDAIVSNLIAGIILLFAGWICTTIIRHAKAKQRIIRWQKSRTDQHVVRAINRDYRMWMVIGFASFSNFAFCTLLMAVVSFGTHVLHKSEILDALPKAEATVPDAIQDIASPDTANPSKSRYWSGILICLILLWLVYICISLFYQSYQWLNDALLSLRLERSLEILTAVSTRATYLYSRVVIC